MQIVYLNRVYSSKD